jgi:hypothetical protein
MQQSGEQPKHGESEFSSAHLAEELEQSQERQRPATEFRFAFCKHFEPDNATLAAEWLKDCDVVAVEAVGGAPEVRAEAERDYNEFVQRAAAGESVADLLSLIEDESPFTRQLLTKLAGYGPKRILLIDAGDADEVTSTFQPYEDAQETYRGSSLRHMSLHELQRATRDFLQASANREGGRETLQASQLQQLAQPETGPPPHKIGVVVGLEHTPTRDRLDQLGYTTSQRQINVVSPGYLRQDIPQSAEARAGIFLRSHPDEPLPTTLVNRVILEQIYETVGDEAISNDLCDPNRPVSRWDLYEQTTYRIMKLVEAMDDASVASLLQKLEHLYQADYEEDPFVIDEALEENYSLYRDSLVERPADQE